jgi:transcriptional regulator with GAF, ATPase, and Fis domain
LTGKKDLLDLSILFEAARSFVGLHEREAILRNGLLSVLGAAGTASIAFLQPDGDSPSRFRTAAARGLSHAPESVSLRQRTRQRLTRDPGPHLENRLPDLDPKLHGFCAQWGFSMLVALVEDETLTGLLFLGARIFPDDYSERDLELTAELASLMCRALRGTTYVPRRSTVGTRASGRRITRRLRELREQHPPLQQFVGEGTSTLELLEELVSLREFELPVLIQGETGTGKELVARLLHELSPRSNDPFKAINCAAVPTELVSSILFGHERGAFTGAIATAKGVFERAGRGTVLLDEIGDMPVDTQASLLRVLQEKEFCRIGGENTLPMAARVITATHQDLQTLVSTNRFRADLFYRIRMYPLTLPPLRERREELPLLVEHLLEKHSRVGRARPRASREFLAELAQRDLPGNIRELEGLVAGAIVHARGGQVLLPEHLDLMDRRERAGGSDMAEEDADSALNSRLPGARHGGPVRTYRDMEREYIQSVLQVTSGNKKDAAALMKIPRTTLNAKMRRLGLS